MTSEPKHLTEREQHDLQQGIRAAELEDQARRVTDPEMSRIYAIQAAKLRRDIKAGTR